MSGEMIEQKIERQKAIELDCVALGKARYRAERMPWQKDAAGVKEEADLTPGKLLLKRNVDAVAEALREYIDAAVTKKAVHKSAAAQYLVHIEPLQAAYIALRFAINGASGGQATVTAVARNIGDAIQEHLEMVKMGEDHPGLYRKLSGQLARSTSAKHRLGVLRHVREKYNLARMEWSVKERIQIGLVMIHHLLNSTSLFQEEKLNRGRNKTLLYLTLTPETLEWLEESHGRCELLSPVHLPMIVSPRPWRTPYAGGYLTNLLRPRLIHTTNRDYLNELGGVDLSQVTSAVNAIQETGWRISRPILDVLLEELEAGGDCAGLPRKSELPLPPLPPTIPKGTPSSKLTASQKEDLTGWKAEAAKVHVANAQARTKRITLAQKLYVARRFADEEVIYFPHYIDFRGRVYPLASYINPQSDDIGRALLEFAEGKPLGEDGAFWLAVHIAGIWGVDKVTFQERVDWVFEHEEEILASAIDPHESRFWTTADDGKKPWQGLAACIEWLGYKVNGDAHVSHLPIAMDGTCSGLQHYSALLRDEVGGAAVNLVPSERPADIYTMVAQKAQELSDARLGGPNHEMARAWQGKFCRKVAKQPTMTLCYSATKYGMKGQIEDALCKLDENGPYLEASVNRHQAALYASGVVLEALEDTVVAARRAMDWLRDVAGIAVKAGVPIRWTSPIGLPVLQDYRDPNEKQMELYVGGKKWRVRIHSDSERLSGRRQSSGIAPNFVHALDASHLLTTVNECKVRGLKSFAVIHDSFAVHAADTETLNAVLRACFVMQYREALLEQLREEVSSQIAAVRPKLVKKLPRLPRCGVLDLEGVLRSEFFFA